MQDDFSDSELKEALDNCASEPVHIPGAVQPVGVLLAFSRNDLVINYISANANDLLGILPEALLGRRADEVLGKEIWHGIKDAQSYSLRTREPVGRYDLNDHSIEITAFETNDHICVEVEPASTEDQPSGSMIRGVKRMTGSIQSTQTQEVLFETTVQMLRHLTGYDRVMLYKFDSDFNGEVVAEDKRACMSSFLGLRFPHWDIPSQARDIMRVLPLRFIHDVDEASVPILARDDGFGPLDITQSHLRSVSRVHMQYLRNMDIQATMTLSIMVGKNLWGIVSFHHRKPKVPSLRHREMLLHFISVFSAKITILLQEQTLALIRKIDEGKEEILSKINENTELEDAFGTFSAALLEALKADGTASITGSKSITYGNVPGPSVLAKLLEISTKNPADVVAIDSLEAQFPELSSDLNGCAGALVAAAAPARAIAVFRPETKAEVAWAGNPDKTITDVGGQKRLEPRGSFLTYLQQVEGKSQAWSDEDHFFARRLWAILYSSERRALMNRERRQQDLMINELNHRVRNILSLVRSVSRQARKKYGSLSSYSRSLEARIQALAAAHDIGSGSSRSEVSIKEIIEKEIEPYVDRENPHLTVLGVDRHIISEQAPIFALIVHELVTNAAKYGALSNATGTVTITLSLVENGLSMVWCERNGPFVVEPEERGFGSALIEQAVPHEMNGSAILKFLPKGVEADIWLPFSCLELRPSGRSGVTPYRTVIAKEPSTGRPPVRLKGEVMLVEDNFLIAADMSDMLKSLGFEEVSVVSSVANAMEYLDYSRPDRAVLDVNLGDGTTSLSIARRLFAIGVPFIFSTGYGDRAEFPVEYADITKLTKPVEKHTLRDALAQL